MVVGTATTVRRVLVVDDHRSFAELLGTALDSEDCIECVGIATDARDALAKVHDLRPDVVVVDIEMPDQNGLTVTRRLLRIHAETVVVVVTAHLDPVWLARATQAGASGFVPKNGSLDEIVTAIRAAVPGSMHVAPSAFHGGARVSRHAEPTITLTAREREVLLCMSKGMPPKAVARLLGITLHTARGYVKTLLAKLNASSQLEAVLKAQQIGLVPTT